jgi:hypothetical protein
MVNMKLKVCPKCGNTDHLAERWAKGRMLEQCCHAPLDVFGYLGSCNWVGTPYTPEKICITTTVKVRLDEIYGWHYQVFDKYGHVVTDSVTYGSKAEAMEELVDDITPKEGYDDPAAPYTAILVRIPPTMTLEGEAFQLVNGKTTEVEL